MTQADYNTYNESTCYTDTKEYTIKLLIGDKFSGGQVTSYEDKPLIRLGVKRGDSDTDDSFNIVKSYTIEGGPETPFETISLTLSHKNLTAVYPELDDLSKVDLGNSKIKVNAIGNGEFIVTKCKLSGGNYKLTGYCIAERLRGYTLSVDAYNTPLGMMLDILTSDNYGCKYSAGNIVSNVDMTNMPAYTFCAGANIWTILQICAMYCNSKIFFSAGLVYIIDYTILDEFAPKFYEENPMELYGFASVDSTDRLYNKVLGEVNLGDEGTDTLRNDISVKWSVDRGENTYIKAPTNEMKVRNSKLRYGTHSMSVDISSIVIDQYENTVDGSTDIIQGDFAQKVADMILAYRGEPQESIGFTVGERMSTGGWSAEFPTVFAVKEITSLNDGITLTNKSSISEEIYPQMLALSRFMRKYPDTKTEYWFGIASTVDLASSTSQIRAKLGE